jgi:hypothetical protein
MVSLAEKGRYVMLECYKTLYFNFGVMCYSAVNQQWMLMTW